MSGWSQHECELYLAKLSAHQKPPQSSFPVHLYSDESKSGDIWVDEFLLCKYFILFHWFVQFAEGLQAKWVYSIDTEISQSQLTALCLYSHKFKQVFSTDVRHIIQQPVCNWFELMKWTVCECTVQNKYFFNCSLRLERNSTDSGQGGIFLVYMCWACMLSNGMCIH